MNFEDILTLLIGTAETKPNPSQLIEACRKFNMHQIEYYNLNGDPLFNIGYNFIFKTERGEEARLEIIQVDDELLQAGFQVIYKSMFFFQKAKRDFSYIFKSLKTYYHNEQIQDFGVDKIFNLYNDISHCYISRSKINGKEVITFRVSNKETWTKYNH